MQNTEHAISTNITIVSITVFIHKLTALGGSECPGANYVLLGGV